MADIVAGQHDPPPAWDPTDRVSVGRTLLALALDLDQHIVQGRSTDEAVARVRQGGRFPERLLGALAGLTVALDERVPRSVQVSELVPGMVLDSDVVDTDDVKLVARGHQVTPTMIERLRAHDATNGVRQPLRVLVTRPAGWTG